MQADTNSSVQTQENTQFRLLYAVGIIIIVSTHCGGGGLNLFYDWFPDSAFQLGLFTFASGYFYKPVAECHPLRYIAKKIRHLLVPLFLWNLAYAFFIMFLKTKGFAIGSDLTLYTFFVSPWNDGHQFKFTMAGWYIAPPVYEPGIPCPVPEGGGHIACRSVGDGSLLPAARHGRSNAGFLGD